jgi:hypothetical protein
MYIIAIAWLYVTVLMAATETSWVAGVMTFLFYGLLPVSILVYLMGAPERRRRRQRQEAAASELQREAKDHD